MQIQEIKNFLLLGIEKHLNTRHKSQLKVFIFRSNRHPNSDILNFYGPKWMVRWGQTDHLILEGTSHSTIHWTGSRLDRIPLIALDTGFRHVTLSWQNLTVKSEVTFLETSSLASFWLLNMTFLLWYLFLDQIKADFEFTVNILFKL